MGMGRAYTKGLGRALIAGVTILGMAGVVTSPTTPLVARAATIAVTNTNDSGAGSLRQAIADAASGDTITFASSVTGPIILTSGELPITTSLTIDNTASGRQAIDGNHSSRVFEVGAGATVTLTNLQIQNGVGMSNGALGAATGQGGGIYSAGALTLDNSAVVSNTVTGTAGSGSGSGGGAAGGGVYATGPLALTGVTVVSNNSATGGAGGSGTVFPIFGPGGSGGPAQGGGVYIDGDATVGAGSIVSGNSATGGAAGSGGIFLGGNGGSSYGGGFYNAGGTLTVNGATISGNTASGGSSNPGFPGGSSSGFGGGVYALGALSMSSATIASNTASAAGLIFSGATDGGGVYAGGGATLADSTITGNRANSGSGGGVYATGAAVALTNSPVMSNTASSGGGVYAAGPLTMTNSPISGNTAALNGGGVYVPGALLFLNNSVAGSRSNGPRIAIGGGAVTIMDNPVMGNTANGAGGGLYVNSPLTVTASTVISNSAHTNGGGLVATGLTTLSQDAVVSNTAGADGGGVLATADITLTNVTMGANTAIGQGGAISTTGALSATAVTIAGNSALTGGGIASATGVTSTLAASILTGDTATNGPDCAGALVSGGYLVLGASAGCAYTPGPGDIVGQDALLGPLADNGGSTLTYALLPGSPAIGIVPPASGLCLPTDQRGVSRPGTDKSACDSGAYESAGTAPTATATDSATATGTSNPTATGTGAATGTAQPTIPAGTATPSPTATNTNTAIPSATNTSTATSTSTNTSTATPSATPSATSTATPNVNNGPTTLYFAEGYTGRLTSNGKANFDETLSILNANPFTATVQIQYLIEGGSPVVVIRSIAPASTLRESVNSDAGNDKNVAAVVSSASRVTAERIIRRTGAAGVLDANSSLGNPSLGKTFYFAEGYTGASFQEYLTLANPGNTTANVTVNFAPQGATGSVTQTLTLQIPPQGRVTRNIRRDTLGIPNKSLGLVVTSDQPIMAERVLYFGDGDGSAKYGSTAKAGIQTVGNQYIFAYGSAGGTGLAQRPGDQSFVTVLNPGTSPVSATIVAQFYDALGRDIGSTSLAVAPGTRETLNANQAVSNTASIYATMLTSASPFVAEKPQYFGGSPNAGAHPGVAPTGAPAGMKSAAFPDLNLVDAAGQAEQQTVFLYNPTSAPITVTGTYYSGNGSKSQVYNVPAGNIVTVNVNTDAAGLPAGALGATFTVTSAGATDSFVATNIANTTDGRSYTGNQGALPAQ